MLLRSSGPVAIAVAGLVSICHVSPVAGQSASPPSPQAAAVNAPQVPMNSSNKVTPWGRVSFFANTTGLEGDDLPGSTQAEYISSVSYRLIDRPNDGLEFGLDVRHSQFSTEGRESRLSIYDGFVGARLAGGAFHIRGGHMWLNDLGGLGSVAGGLAEFRSRRPVSNRLGRVRAGVFGGAEPKLYETGYESGVRKYGGYVAVEGTAARRHVAGYVRVQNGSLTERSVLTLTNFLPIGQRFFMYQAAEYDIRNPAGHAEGGWTYFFTNARLAPVNRVDLQLTISRGRSIDARGLSEDVLAGRPVPRTSIDGLLYRSIGGRATVEVFRGSRVHVGYARDNDNRQDRAAHRWLFGGYFNNVGRSGFDVTVSDHFHDRAAMSYHSRYFSVGRQIGARTYVTGDYSTSLSVVRFVRGDGFLIETRPETSRFGLSGMITLGRAVSLLASLERTRDADLRSLRILSGVTYRLR